MRRISHEAIKSCPDKGCKNIISLPDQNLPLKAPGLTPLSWPGPPYTPHQSELSWRGADQSERSILSQTLNCLEGRREERRGHVLGSVLGLCWVLYICWPDMSSHQLVLQRQLGLVTSWKGQDQCERCFKAALWCLNYFIIASEARYRSLYGH